MNWIGSQVLFLRKQSNTTPLQIACYQGHHDIVQSLLGAGADVNTAISDVNITPLYMASQNGHHDVVQSLLGAGADVNTARSDDYTTPLYAASQNGYHDVVQSLLGAGADVNTAKSDDGQSPLWAASCNGHLDVVKKLIEAGANINQANKNNATPLFVASQKGYHDVVQSLLGAGADVNTATSDNNATPLYIASQKGHHDVVQSLFGAGADVNTATFDLGETALIRASAYGHVECVKALLGRGAQANHKDIDVYMALIWASLHGHVDCVKALLDKLDLGVQAKPQDKEELIEAVKNGKVEEVIRLLQLGERTAKDPEVMLMEAAKGGWTEEMIAILDAGVNIDLTYKDGQSALITPLLHASLHGHVQCVKALLDRGAQTNLQDKDGHNALMNASLYGHVECVNVLLGRGARPNLQDKDGRTALHWAAERNHIGTVKALLATPGIDVNIQDSHGVIPLKLATKYEILAMLQKYTISCEDYPIHSFGKVILCGDTGSGKSTLAKAIKYCSQQTLDKGKPPGATLPGPVKPLTAGIVPHLIKNQEMNMMLYDLAGHREYYSSHCAVLEAISLSPSTFLMLLNLLLDIEDIAAQLYYWSAMIGDVCYKCPQQSSVIVVGTHADGIADRGLLESLCGAVERVARDALKMHTFVGVTAINATAIHGKIMKSFISSLRLTNDSVIAKHPAISLNSHMMYAFLIDKVPPHQDAISLPQLVILLGQEEPKVLPTEVSQITLLLKTLSNKGFIVFLEGDEVNSWIVIRPEALLEKVNGVLFAPSFFKEHLPIASNTGVISVAVLRQHFPEPTYNIDMIVQFMKSFELCVPITLTNVDTNMTPAGSPNTPSTDTGPLLFFPACVSVEMPSSVTIPQKGFGWQIWTADINQFFSPRCVHALSTRLAHGWALPKVESALIAGQKGHNRRCTVWSRGISWMNKKGVTTVVEIKDNSRCLSCTIASSESSPKYLLSVIKVIKEACGEFCPSVSLVELITCPAAATSDHTPATVELPLLKETVQTKENELADSTGKKQVIVSEWKKVEPRLLDLIGMEKNEEQATPSPPTLEQLLFFTGKAPTYATFNVAALVGIAYSKMGVLLLKDETGAVVQALEHEHMRNAEKINTAIFSQWLQGKGAQPVAWPTLIGVLRKIGLCVLADDIEGGLKK